MSHVTEWIHLPASIAKTRFANIKGADREDLISEGFVALVKAGRHFDADICEFSTYATRAIVNQMLWHLRRKSQKRQIFWRHQLRSEPRIEGPDLVELRDLFENLVPDERDRFMLKSVYVDGLRYEDVAKLVGMSESGLYYRLRRIKARCRENA